jgi:hypothetical protein
LTAYFISGLGADRKVFSKIKLPSGIRIKHIEWIEPLKKESLENYCRRLSAQMNEEDQFIFVGLSFGGIVAIELNKFLPAKQIILISSISTKYELPSRYRIINFLKLIRILPAGVLKFPLQLVYWFFNARSEKEKELLKYYIKHISGNYLKWSLNAVLNWKNKQRPSNLFHIHGTSDRIFPCEKTHADVKIKNGGHLIVYDKANQVSNIICGQLKSVL